MRSRLVTLIGAASLMLAVSAPAAVGTPKPGTPECPATDGPDFDGVHGGPDLAVGMPTATVSGHTDAGRVEIRYGCGSSRTVQGLHLPHPHTGDDFGATVLDANQSPATNQPDDLIVGIPDYDVGSAKDAGAIAVFPGSSSGLKAPTIITQASKGVAGTPQAGAHFGAALSVFTPYDSDDQVIRIGVPGKTVDGQKNAGAVVELHLTDTAAHDHTSFTSRQYTLDNVGMPGLTAGEGDLMGASLYENSAIGLPARTVDGLAGAGAVLYGIGSGATLVTQDTACLTGGAAQAGARFGAVLADRWIGAPGETVDGKAGAGQVQQYRPDHPQYCFTLTQDTDGVDGDVTAGNHFGAALAESSFEDDEEVLTPFGMAVGVPGADQDNGSVDLLTLDFDLDVGAVSEAVTGAGSFAPHDGSAQARFGSTVAAGVHPLPGPPAQHGQDLLVGAPGGYDGRGLVYALPTDYGVAADAQTALFPTAVYQQRTGVLQHGTGYGSALLGSHNPLSWRAAQPDAVARTSSQSSRRPTCRDTRSTRHPATSNAARKDCSRQ